VTINDIIKTRKIEEVLHFTTNNALVGILRQGLCKSRKLLKEDESLTYILKLNTEKEFDREWKGYVNLSISRINTALFEYSTRVNHTFKWRILSFSPEILTHPGVHFTTTNNAYWQHLKRGEGPVALEELFAQCVMGKYGVEINRLPNMADSWTTDVQAEVLYPQSVSMQYLTRIYVRTPEEADSVSGKFATFELPTIPTEVAPDKFY
jgi:hypothetical protein